MQPQLGIPEIVVIALIISSEVVSYRYSKGPGCGALLTRDIVNRTIQTTTAFNSSVDEKYAILNSSSAWCSSDLDTFQYLRINFGKQAHLTGLDIQGKRFSNYYITQFKVAYKTNDTQQLTQYYPSDSNPKVFQMAPVSGDEIMHFSLNNTVMKSLFIFPSQWNKHICIRIELYGCVPVDGGFTSWSDWSCCSRSCGNGTKVRYRSCTNPAPANGGLECTGERNQTESCLGTSCPVEGGFSNWSNWTKCSVTCGTGFQLRTRSCTNPLPEHGGKLCPELSSAEGRNCTLQPCRGNSVDVGSWKADREEIDNKYFVPMVVLAVALALFVIFAVAFWTFNK